MAVNAIVAGVTLFLLAAITGWLAWPTARAGIEAPKHQPLGWDTDKSP